MQAANMFSVFDPQAATGASNSPAPAPNNQFVWPQQSSTPQVEVPGFFLVSGRDLVPLSGARPAIQSPADHGIAASSGDDETAPNATTAQRLNRVVCSAVANVGFSDAKKDSSIPPCAISYEAEVTEGPKGYSMSLRIVLEYASSFPDEGMVVWLKKKQQFINDEKLSELMLIETCFEDWVDGRWMPINTDIRYAEEAEAVVQAVITSDSGQTAGRVKTAGGVEDAKLGPVGQRGRIILTYFCEELYSYAEMDLGVELHRRSLVPLAFQLPWAPFDSPAAACQVKVNVRGPAGAKMLSPAQHILAYQDLQQSLARDASNAQRFGGVAVMIPEEKDAEIKFDRTSLPPKPAMVLAWFSIPDADDGWEQVGSSLPPATRVTLLQPRNEDAPFMSCALPGGQTGQLLRCCVDTEAAERRADVVRVHTDIVISDASGSTGMRVAGLSESVRACFNKHEERRVIKRLEAIPQLRAAGLLHPSDIWRVLFVAFDHGVRAEFALQASINDLDQGTVSQLVETLTGEPTKANLAETSLNQQGKGALLQTWRGFIANLRSLGPGGTTSFVAGAKKAKDLYSKSTMGNLIDPSKQVERTTYVNFDTDGGNNCGPCYEAIKQLVAESDVVQGHVLGIGSWVDQDCASKVAKILKGTTNLAMTFPSDAAADMLFRQDLSRWIKVVRSQPISMTISAGPSSWQARQGTRSENAVECVFARGEGLRFGAPDISQLDFTKACLQGLQAGESATLYILTRLSIPELQRQLAVEVGGRRATVCVGPEVLRGVTLGHHWLSLLGGGPAGAVPVVANKATLCSRLKQRLEDDLSFAWNLPTKSGSTAALGRSRTQHRRPVAQDQQPEEPIFAKEPVESDSWGVPAFGNSWNSPPPMGLPSGMAPPATPFARCSSPPSAAAFGCAQPLMAAPTAAAAPMGGGMGGMGGGMGGGMLFGGAAGPPMMQMGASGGGLFGGGGSSSFGGGGLFGAPAQDGWGAAPHKVDGPEGPTSILSSSRLLGFGPSDVQYASDVVRAVKALKWNFRTPDSVPGAQAQAVEDPLVQQLLGAAPSGGRETVHTGFTCDHCRVSPIRGPRFKATNKVDIDVCFACRMAGTFAGGTGFVRLPDAETALRSGLQAVLDWWPLVFGQHRSLFQHSTFPQLSTLPMNKLREAVSNLPETL